MANILIKDLALSSALDDRQMADVTGGLAMRESNSHSVDSPVSEPRYSNTSGITILGEEKYGGWGGEW